MSALKWMFHPVTLMVMIVAASLYINRDTFYVNPEYSVEVESIVNKVDSLIDDLQSAPSDTTSGQEERGGESVVGTPNFHDTPSVGTTTYLAGEEDTVPPVASLAAEKTDGQLEVVEGMSDEESRVTLPSALNNEIDTAKSAVSGLTSLPENGEDTAITRTTGVAVTAAETGDSEGRAQVGPLALNNEQLWKIWQKARLSAWNGDASSAIKHYQKIITLQPDNYDAYGEMGNVMMSAGDSGGAAEAYYQAAQRLNKTEHRGMAWHLLNVIARLSPAKADKLYQELSQP